MSDYIQMKNKFISSFDILPNEILFLIFNYLPSNDIIYSFFYYNQRLQNLLLTQIYHFNIPTTNLNFWNETLPIIGLQIQTLIIHIDYLTIPLDLFSNLTSIIISSPYSLLKGQLTSILNHHYFQNLHQFKIKDDILSDQLYMNARNDEQILFNRIFDDKNKLQVFQYLPLLKRFNPQNLNQLNSNIHIRSLTLNLFKLHDIIALIQHTPNLIYLNIQLKTPRNNSKQFHSANISQIKLEEFYFKLKSRIIIEDQINRPTIVNLDELFRFIRLFSSSLITLSLDFTDIFLIDSSSVVFNGIKLENELLKPMTKLQNFYFYATVDKCKNIQEILSTFKTFPWSIGVHENRYLYSLPFPFHELKHFRHFQYVLSNDDKILKDNHRLWCNVTSLGLIFIDQIDLKNLLSLIKLNMPKLSSITLFDNDRDDSCYEIERINVDLYSVTTVRLIKISMKKIQQILIHSFPNLQCLILDNTELPSEENELTSFLGKKIQRIESDEPSLQENRARVKDFSYLSNLKYMKLTYGLTYYDGDLNSRSRIVSNLLTKLPKLETLSIYAIPYSGCAVYGPTAIFRPIMNRLDEDQIKSEYKIKYSGDYMWFIRNTIPSFYSLSR